MIKKENFISSVGANTQPGYVEQMIAQHNEDFTSHGAHFHEVAEDLNVHEQKDMHLQEGERKRWDLAAETVSKIPAAVAENASRAEKCAASASVSELTANAAAAAAALAKAHAATYRDRAEKYAADSQAAAGIAVNAKTAAEQAYGNTLNMAGQMSIEHNEMRTAFENLEDAYESFESNLDKKADKQTEGGGFVGGLDAVSEDSAVSVGKGAKSKNGGFAAGLNAEANAGAGVGMGAKAYNYGGAVGRNAVAGKGFSGGDGALAAQRTHGADRVNCIQLGEGVNNVEKSLQVYEFQLMDGNGKIPEERLPELEKHFVLRGTVSDLDSLPDSKNVGDVYIVESERQFSKPCAQVVGGMELFSEDSPGNRYYQLSDVFASAYSEFISTDTAYLYNPDGSLWGPIFYNAPAAGQRLEGLNGYNTKFEPDSSFRFYVCKERGLKMNGGQYVWNGLCWDRISPEFFLEDLEEKLSEKADRQTESGGFQAGAATTVGNTGATEGGAIGKNAKETNGGFAGGAGANASYGGVIGKRAAEKNGGGAAGLDTYANAGGAVGSGAVAGSGFSGGKGAKAAPIDESKGTYIDAVQLGTGTNEVPGSLQVYEFQLMDGSGKIPVERLPETVTNSNWGGVVSSWAGLPSTPKLGMYCYVSSDIANGEKYTGKASDMFFSMSNEYPSEILPLGPIKFTAPENCIEPYGTSFAEGYVCVYTENGSKIGKLVYNPTGLPDFIRGEELGLTSMDDTVTFYLGYWDGTNFPAKIEKFSAGSMIFWNGTKWCGVASSDTVGEIETALDGILSIQNALIGGGSE